jgi:DNA-directed RNA polymerase subunit F
MIHERMPLNMNEVEQKLKEIPDNEKKEETRLFLKKFSKTKQDKAKKIREALEGLDMMKLKPEHVVKIVDLLPEDATDLSKIFTDVSLNEDETNKILEIVKNS